MSKTTLHTIIGLLFVISGATGLIYQIVWFKYLSLFLGNTTYAQTMVLAAFMGGLAIGAWLWGRRADRAGNPLAVYALLELGIGVYCFLYPFILELSKNAFVGLVHAGNHPSDGSVVLFLKLFLSLVTLLVPTILMGGTLPVLVRALSTSVEESGRNVAILYFLNSLGAVIGAALGGFLLIPMFGLSASLYSAATVNVLLGAGVLMLGRIQLKKVEGQATEGHREPSSYSNRQVIAAVVTAGVSGAAAMVYEICWVRLLLPVLGSSTYSFSVMLIAFISGITIGSLLVSRLIVRAKNLFGLLSVCQIGITLSMIATLPLYGRLPYEFFQLATILNRSNQIYPYFLSLEFFFCFLVVVIPTVFMGMTLPVASRIATRSVAVMGKSIGNVFSVNTFGTVLGSLLCGLVFIPAIGVKRSLELGLALNLFMAAALWYVDPLITKAGRSLRLAAVFALALLYLGTAPNWSQSVMLSGVFRQINRENPITGGGFGSFVDQYARDKKLYYKEGRSATVAVIEKSSGADRQLVLVVNGKPDASSRADLPSQTLVGQLPMMLQHHPDSVLVIGLGSGVTLGSVLTHDVQYVDCAEISPEVVEASHCFDGMNNRPLDNPRAHLYLDDALSFLKLSRNTYDVIVSEPTNPWIAGVGNLYTSEFFEQCKAHMTKDGMMVQWFHLYEMDDATLRIVVRTFRRAFPHVSIWQSMNPDIIMLGSATPLSFEPDTLKHRFGQGPVRRDFHKIQIDDIPTLLSTQLMTGDEVDFYAGSGPLNTEDHPLIEYDAPRAVFVNRTATELIKFDERMTTAPHPLLLRQYVKSSPLTDADLLSIAHLHLGNLRGSPTFGLSIAMEYLARNPDSTSLLAPAAATADLLGLHDQALEFHARLVKLKPRDPTALATYAWAKYTDESKLSGAFTPKDFSQVEDLLTRAIDAAEDTVDSYRIMLGDCYFDTQRYDKSVECFRRALTIRGTYENGSGLAQDALLLRLSEALHGMGNERQAEAYAAQALLANQDNQRARAFLDALLENERQ